MVRNAVLAFVFSVGLCGIPGSATAAPAPAAPNPALSQKWVVYGQQVFATRNYDKAIQAFSTAARANSRNAAAWKGLGNCFYAKRNYPYALKYYKFAYQLNPSDTGLGAYIPKLEAATSRATTSSQADLAARYYNARRYDEAIQHYNMALATNPNDAKAWQGLGNCYYVKRDKPKAVEAYKKAIQLNPRNVGLQNFLARYAPESAAAAGIEVAYGPKDWFQPLWRSAVLPGWGQFYNETPVKGGVVMAADLILMGGAIGTYMIGSAARDKYNSLGSSATQADFDASLDTWKSMADLNHIFNIGWGVVYAFNLVDAIMSAKRHPMQKAEFQEKAPAFEVSSLPGENVVGAKLRLLEF